MSATVCMNPHAAGAGCSTAAPSSRCRPTRNDGPAADAQRPATRAARHRLHRRRRHLRAAGHRGRALRGTGRDDFLPDRGFRLRARRAVLRGARLDDAGLGFGVRLLLCRSRRGLRLVARLAAALRIWPGRGAARGRVLRLSRQPAARLRYRRSRPRCRPRWSRPDHRAGGTVLARARHQPGRRTRDCGRDDRCWRAA